MGTPKDHEIALVWLESGRAALQAGLDSIRQRAKGKEDDPYWAEASAKMEEDIASLIHSRFVLLQDGGYNQPEPAGEIAPVHLSGEFIVDHDPFETVTDPGGDEYEPTDDELEQHGQMPGTLGAFRGH